MDGAMGGSVWAVRVRAADGVVAWSQHRRHISEVPVVWVASSPTSPQRAVGFLEIAALTSLMMA
jgi:hypothetical protein